MTRAKGPAVAGGFEAWVLRIFALLFLIGGFFAEGLAAAALFVCSVVATTGLMVVRVIRDIEKRRR